MSRLMGVCVLGLISLGAVDGLAGCALGRGRGGDEWSRVRGEGRGGGGDLGVWCVEHSYLMSCCGLRRLVGWDGGMG